MAQRNGIPTNVADILSFFLRRHWWKTRTIMKWPELGDDPDKIHTKDITHGHDMDSRNPTRMEGQLTLRGRGSFIFLTSGISRKKGDEWVTSQSLTNREGQKTKRSSRWVRGQKEEHINRSERIIRKDRKKENGWRMCVHNRFREAKIATRRQRYCRINVAETEGDIDI